MKSTLFTTVLSAALACALTGEPPAPDGNTPAATIAYQGSVRESGGTDKLNIRVRDESGKILCKLEAEAEFAGGESNSARAEAVTNAILKEMIESRCAGDTFQIRLAGPVIVLTGEGQAYRIEVHYRPTISGRVKVDDGVTGADAPGEAQGPVPAAPLPLREGVLFTFKGVATGEHPDGGPSSVAIAVRDSAGFVCSASVATAAGQPAADVARELHAQLTGGSSPLEVHPVPGGGLLVAASEGALAGERSITLFDTGITGGMVLTRQEPAPR